MTIKEMKGLKFGRLTVLEYAGQNKRHSAMWKCQCECGNQAVVDGNSLRRGATRSCGCLNDEVRRGIGCVPNRTTHGMCGTRIYRIWKSICARCNNPHIKYADVYINRGIKMCDEWRRFEPFYEWSMNNGYDDTLSIDRIDVNGNYEPNNCRWATIMEQANNKRNTIYITINGVTHNIYEWSQISGLSRNVIYNRYHNGKTGESIIAPINPNKLKRRSDGN